MLLFALLLALGGQAQPDGRLDATFNPGTGFDGIEGPSVYSIALQPDGKVLVAGFFERFNGVNRKSIARLNANGSLDASFNPGSGIGGGFGGSGLCVLVLPSGKILVGGNFSAYNGQTQGNIARINPDGSLDGTFNTGSGFNSFVFSIAMQPDGKLLVGGDFTSFNGVSCNRIARLNADGTLDASFQPGNGADGYVYCITPQADGNIWIGGWFNNVGGRARKGIALLNANGTLNTSFNPGSGVGGIIKSISLLPGGNLVIGGYFNSYNGTLVASMAKIGQRGGLDRAFTQGRGFWGPPQAEASTITPLGDGRLLITGSFYYYDNDPRKGIIRLNANGTIDPTFNPGDGMSAGGQFDPVVRSHAIQPDGKILVAGKFTTFGGVSRNGIARLSGTPVLAKSELPTTATIWPNPATHSVRIECAGPIRQARLVNLAGQEVIHLLAGTQNLAMDVTSLPRGLYIVELQTAQGQWQRQRLIVE